MKKSTIRQSPRPVRIALVRGCWAVLYCDRRKGQRHAAAGFYAYDHSLEHVQNWVRNNPRLTLITDCENMTPQ
jgi:hypothetical protein